MTMTRSQKATWSIYISRLQRIVEEQRVKWAAGFPAQSMILDVPSKEQISFVELAINETRDEAIHDALLVLIRAIDDIDNSHSKSETVKIVRADLETACDVMRKLKVGKAQEPAE